MEKTAQRDGLFDAAGRWIAPAQGNEAYAPPPARKCIHGQLCDACRRS